MRTPSFLDATKVLLDAVERRLNSPDDNTPIGPMEWLWLGRTLRTMEMVGYDRPEVAPVGDRLIRLVKLVREKDVRLGAELESLFLDATAKAAAFEEMTLARCVLRDNIASYEAIANFFCEDLIVWDSSGWEGANNRSEEDLCDLLRNSDFAVKPKPPLRVFDGATFTFDPADPLGDGWLACLALWPNLCPWWVEHIRADLGDVLARAAKDLNEAHTALVMVPELPSECPEHWSDSARTLLEAGPRGVESRPVDF